MKKLLAFALAGAAAFAANARVAELPKWMYGIEIASIGSTGQWARVEHRDWAKAKVVREGGNATGRVEKVVFVTRDLSDIWDDKEAMNTIRHNCLTPHFFYRGVGSSTSTKYGSVFGSGRGVVLSSAGLAGNFKFRERDDGTKTLRLSVRLMTDGEWAAWTKKHGEPPPVAEVAEAFPESLLGVALPPVAPPDVNLREGYFTTESSDYGKHKFKYWYEMEVPIEHPVFDKRCNWYTWKTKTLAEVRLRHDFPVTLGDDERKAVENELKRLIEADGFTISPTSSKSDTDPAERPWDFVVDAERPDGIHLFANVYRLPERIRRSGEGDVLSLSIILSGREYPGTAMWNEGRCDEQ